MLGQHLHQVTWRTLAATVSRTAVGRPFALLLAAGLPKAAPATHCSCSSCMPAARPQAAHASMRSCRTLRPGAWQQCVARHTGAWPCCDTSAYQEMNEGARHSCQQLVRCSFVTCMPAGHACAPKIHPCMRFTFMQACMQHTHLSSMQRSAGQGRRFAPPMMAKWGSPMHHSWALQRQILQPHGAGQRYRV